MGNELKYESFKAIASDFVAPLVIVVMNLQFIPY